MSAAAETLAPLPPSELVAERGVRRSAYSPVYMTATLAVSDFGMSAAAVLAGFSLWRLVNPAIPPLQPEMVLLPLSCVGSFACTSQYPGVGLTAVEHMRRISKGISTVYLLFLFAMFVAKGSWVDSRGALLLAWGFSMALVSCGRCVALHVMSRRSWWGVPVLVIGAGPAGIATVRNLRANGALGYRPMGFLDDDRQKHEICAGLPVIGTLDDAASVARDLGIDYAILAIPGMPREPFLRHLRRWTRIFRRILVIPDWRNITTQWTEMKDLGGMIGFETHQKLLNPIANWMKRVFDLAGACFGLVVSAPVLAVCVLWIRKTSSGNPFYVHERDGRAGTTLRILKLRTMFHNSEAMLASHLACNPSAREEWGRFCKLKNDPRILPGVGHFLRRTSLDELPQLWNVLKGEMSLVGPRPFPTYHNARFDPDFQQVRTEVRPGLTGLWQVSARSDGDLDVQQSLDTYYIRNWSLWLDIYILARTVRAVLAPRGSY
jgi:Undecaprenyl-phosphate galactose phosphotransferase WbaP